MGNNNQKGQRTPKVPIRTKKQGQKFNKGKRVQKARKLKHGQKRIKRLTKPSSKRRSSSKKSFIIDPQMARGPILTEASQAETQHEGGADVHAPLVSVIIPAMNEEASIAQVVEEASRVHPYTEVIVIVNGSTDRTEVRAKSAGAEIMCYPEALGHDVGRQIGAEAAKGKILLFVDGDMIISNEDMKPFIKAVLSGIDIALNDYKGPVHRLPIHPVVEAKYALNTMLGRSDLKGASMTAVPHAISREAYEALPKGVLETPPLAQAMAVKKGFAVKAVHRVPVGKLNPVRRKDQAKKDLLTDIIIQDHFEAVRWITKNEGSRGGFADLYRARHLVRAR
ncbi:glycosyltransferase [Neobacillus mesonae]|nr:glycosyltransferase [Neobacillus mesonae]